MKYYTLILIFAFIGCKSKQDLELEITTKEINCLDVDMKEYITYRTYDKMPPKESQTIITYKLTNNTSDSYYFNVRDLNDSDYNTNNTNSYPKAYYIQIDKAFIRFIDSKKQPIYFSGGVLKETRFWDIPNYLGYEDFRRYNTENFIIHSGETLYFEWFLVLPFGHLAEDNHYYLDFNKNETYSAQLFLYSDGKDYKKKISRTDLKTIEDNGYKVFDGVIKSKNKIPVVFRKESKVSE